VAFLVYACSSLPAFVVIPCCGCAVDYIEVPCYLRSDESAAQVCCPSSLFERERAVGMLIINIVRYNCMQYFDEFLALA